MYRLLLLCAIVAVVEPMCHRHRKHHCHTHAPFYGNPCPGVAETPKAETLSQMIERVRLEFMEQEEKYQKFCTDKALSSARELYGADNYYLFFSIPNEDADVAVKIQHKFLHATATKKDGSNEIIFEQVKILPDIVKPKDAVYTIQNKDLLKITIPYKVPLGTEAVIDCGVINKDVINVPVVLYTNNNNNNIVPAFDYRNAKILN